MRRTYLILMGVCVTLFLLAGLVVWHFSRTAAVIMTAVAVLIPPAAAIIANAGREP